MKKAILTFSAMASVLISGCKTYPEAMPCSVIPPKACVLKELALYEQDTVTVCAENPRNRSGLFLKKGCTYKFQVIPCEQTWTDGPKLKPFTANGRTEFKVLWGQLFIKMPFAQWFALLGSIDNKRSTYFRIGMRRDKYVPEMDGELICFANDGIGFNDYWYTHNNKGQMTFVITRIK
jgi:hypothetical protein